MKFYQDYTQLKMEVQQLAKLTGISLLLIAQRLLIIRDEKLYQKDNYPNFETFIESELKISLYFIDIKIKNRGDFYEKILYYFFYYHSTGRLCHS